MTLLPLFPWKHPSFAPRARTRRRHKPRLPSFPLLGARTNPCQPDRSVVNRGITAAGCLEG